MRLMPLAWHAATMLAVPSCSIVGPTSFVLPPSATITPVMSSPSKTLLTSAWFVTEPAVTLMRSLMSISHMLSMEPCLKWTKSVPEVGRSCL